MTTRVLNLPSLPKWWNQRLTIFLIVLISMFLHTWSVWQLPTDYDEPVYLVSAQNYADEIRAGNIQGLIHFQGNQEHPALVKLIYSIPYLLFPEVDNSQFYLFFARGISAVFGVLAVWLICKINIWAGFLFVFHSMTLKYTSQAYLEALPMLAMIAAVYFLIYHRESKLYLFFSAFSIGVIAASKYPYLVILPVIFYLLVFKQKRTWKELLIYFGIAVASAILLNPFLWGNPIQIITQNLQFHTQYSQSTHVQSSGYPWYQPVLYLASSVSWHPEIFFFVTSDELVFFVALIGLYFEFRDQKWEVLWFGVGVLALLTWPTKWPQYTLLVTPVMAILAGRTIKRGIDWIRPRNDYWNYLEEMLPQPPKITWFLLLGFVGALTLGKIGYEYSMALNRIGWEQYTTENSPLIADVINVITLDSSGNVLFGSNEGVGLWFPTNELLWGETQQIFTKNNSVLPSNRILSAVYDESRSRFWIGTETGIVYLAEDEIFAIQETNALCDHCMVNDIFIDGLGHVWFATDQGVLLFDGEKWMPFSTDSKVDLTNALEVFSGSIAGETRVLVGTLAGISIYYPENNDWETINWAGSFFGWGGVKDIIQDDQGVIYVATAGGGINVWDGVTWSYFRNTNTSLQSNTALSLFPTDDGGLWAGFGYSTEPGGFVMRLNEDQAWKKFAANNSGYLDGEPLSLTLDQSGRLWIATNGDGIQIYKKAN